MTAGVFLMSSTRNEISRLCTAIILVFKTLRIR